MKYANMVQQMLEKENSSKLFGCYRRDEFIYKSMKMPSM